MTDIYLRETSTEVEINILRSMVHLVGFILKELRNVTLFMYPRGPAAYVAVCVFHIIIIIIIIIVHCVTT